MTPKIEHEAVMLSMELQIMQFPTEKHLKERERQYCNANLFCHGFYVIRETEDGWWRESIDFKGDILKQMEKLNNDPTVACGWINQRRFNEPGGWYDPC